LVENHIFDILIRADVQTSGRGRLNKRIWVSENGNFHGSFIIKLGIKENSITILNDLLLNIIKNFIDYQKQIAKIKYPNDILINNRKVAGVLVEVCYPYAVMGIGFNIKTSPIENSTNIPNVSAKELIEFIYCELEKSAI
jgi:BirA family biotin operon repressor/biotin-[acetyl-CoA-carboxylase] ligase